MTNNKQLMTTINTQVFTNGTFGELRVLMKDDESWFVGKDVAKMLGYSKPENAIAIHVDVDDKTSTLIQGSGSNYKSKTIIINESGLYSLIMASKLPTAKQFKRWVTSEVLPAIRKHGGYLTPEKIEEALLNPDTLIKLASQLKIEREKRLAAETKVKELQPKSDYYNAYMAREKVFSMSEVGQNMGMSYQKVYKRLIEAGWVCKPVGCKYQLTEQAPEGVFQIIQRMFKGKYGKGDQICVTPHGLKVIQELFDK